MRIKGIGRLGAAVAAFATGVLMVAAPQAQAAGANDTAAATAVSTGTAATAAARDCQGICVLGVRAATHAGYDRFVIDMGEGTIPSWTTSTQTTPLLCCGDPDRVVPIEGKVYLKIYLSPATTFDFTTLTSVYTSPGYETYNFPSLKGQGRTSIYDPEARAFHIGLALGDHTSYKIFKLSAPNRLVVDIYH
ncbi:AMIN-like domain-containing (lipo)protein [Streptomyces sp. NPDC003327]